jgi:hypothetical protein
MYVIALFCFQDGPVDNYLSATNASKRNCLTDNSILFWRSVSYFRLHLARYIPIASTFKATQILSLCSENTSFGPLVHRLLLTWPDQGIYATRRTSVITNSQFISLLSNFPSLRSLELQCLPYYQAFDDTLHATLASTNALGNIRHLALNNSPYSLRKEEFGVLRSLACLMPRLESLELLNIPLNINDAQLGEEDSMQGLLPPPSFALKKLSIRITSPRVLDPTILQWLLENTIKTQSCTSLTIWLSKRCTDTFIDHSMMTNGASSVKECEGFTRIEESLSLLSPSLTHLSMLGLRTGQAASILSKTNENLKILEVYDIFGFANDGNLLAELPIYSGVMELGIYPNPGMMFGAPPPVVGHPLLLSTPRQQSQHGTGNAAAMTPAAVLRAANAGMRRDPAGLFVPVSVASIVGPPAPAGSTSAHPAASSHTTASSSAEEGNSQQQQHTFTEIPISSHSFIQELGKGNRLSHLKIVKVPDNARFGKRGRWLNKELIKACKRNGVRIEEIKMV